MTIPLALLAAVAAAAEMAARLGPAAAAAVAARPGHANNLPPAHSLPPLAGAEQAVAGVQSNGGASSFANAASAPMTKNRTTDAKEKKVPKCDVRGCLNPVDATFLPCSNPNCEKEVHRSCFENKVPSVTKKMPINIAPSNAKRYTTKEMLPFILVGGTMVLKVKRIQIRQKKSWSCGY